MAKQPANGGRDQAERPKKLGRPKAAASVKRSRILRVRFNPEEWTAIKAAAAKQSQEGATWARAVLLAEARRLAGQ